MQIDGSLYIIIVNWNSKDDTILCVNSLIKAGASPDNIVVVDNASSDGTVDALRHQYGSQIHLIIIDKNLGYGGGLNEGINFVFKYNASWLLLLNNDVVVDSHFFDELINVSNEEPNIKIISPIIYEYAHPKRIWFVGDKIIPFTLLTRSLYRGIMDQGKLNNLIPVDFISGCAMMIHRSVFDAIGLFSTSFFMYGEEVDFLQRARMAGFHSVTATRAKMWHKISASNRDKPGTQYLKIYNQILFYKIYSSFWQLPLMFILTFIRSIFLICRYIVEQKYELIIPSIKGWIKGWINNEVISYDRNFPQRYE